MSHTEAHGEPKVSRHLRLALCGRVVDRSAIVPRDPGCPDCRRIEAQSVKDLERAGVVFAEEEQR